MKAFHRKKKKKIHHESEGFRCSHCHQMIGAAIKRVSGTRHRDHCPFCLYSIHVDNKPGDRASSCGGLMKPIGLALKNHGGEAMVVYECVICGAVHKNRCAADDSERTIIHLLRETLDVHEDKRVNLQNVGICLVNRETVDILLEGIFGRGHIPENLVQ